MQAEIVAAQQADGAKAGASQQVRRQKVSHSLKQQPPQTGPHWIIDHWIRIASRTDYWQVVASTPRVKAQVGRCVRLCRVFNDICLSNFVSYLFNMY